MQSLYNPFFCIYSLTVDLNKRQSLQKPCLFNSFIGWPGIVWPRILWPKIGWPKVEWPKIRWPNIGWPKAGWPKKSGGGRK